MLMLLTAFVTAAGAAEVHLGYCNGVVNKSGSVGATGRNWVDAAMALPASMLNAYAGNDITAVRVGLATKLNVDTVRVWLRSELEGDNLAEGEIVRDEIVRGWNQVRLTSPYTIPATAQRIYVGYTFKQRGTGNVMSYVSTATQDAFWVKLGEGEQWKDLSSQGALSLEAVVSGDNIYSYDIGIANQTARTMSNTDDISVSAVFKNYGTADVHSVKLLFGADGADSNVPVTLSLNLPSGRSVDTTFTVSGLPSAVTLANTIYMQVDNVDGYPDENPANDCVELPFANERKVLIEEFTSESCQNCPRLAATLHSVLSSDNYRGRAVVVCHHDGFSTDFLSMPSDSEYTWFFNKATTYAPALMIDRYPYYTTSENKPTPVSDVDATELMDGLDDRLDVPTYTKLNIAATPHDGNGLSVKVTGFRARPFCDTPARITLYLLEDSVIPRNQQGATAGFRHMHVERVINSTWGEVIDWQENGTFEYDYEMQLSDAWKRNNLSLVAAIGGYDADDLTNCVVENAEQLDLRDILATGISHASVDNAAEVDSSTYTIDGRRIGGDTSRKGVYIVKKRYADGHTVAVKQMR